MPIHLPPTDTLTTLALMLVALWLGQRAPDVDLAPVLPLRHRSAWTHGPLTALAVWWAAGQWPALAPALVMFCAGVARHLIDDLTPERWRGAALISLHPLRVTLPAPLSWLWIASGATSAVWVAMEMM